MAFVQQSTVNAFSGLVATATLTGVTNLNAVICLVGHVDAGGTGPSFTINDGAPYNQDVIGSDGIGYSNAIIASRYAVSAGNYTVTVTATSGTGGNSVGHIQLVEFSNLVTNGFDASATGGTYSTALSIGPSGTLAQNTELLIAALYANQNNGSAGPITTPPVGGPGSFINLGSFHPAADNCVDFDYQLNTGTNAPVSVNWGSLPNASVWAGALGSYKEVGGSTQSADLFTGLDTQEWLADAARLTAAQYQAQFAAARVNYAAQFPVPSTIYQPFTSRQFWPRRRIIT